MGSDADATERLIGFDATVCCAVFQASMAKRLSAGCRCNFSTGETNDECDIASNGVRAGHSFSDVSSGAKSSGVVETQGKRNLLKQLVQVFAPSGVIVLGIDDTIERRWGKRIAARGIYRDAVRSSHEHFVKTSGLRWVTIEGWYGNKPCTLELTSNTALWYHTGLPALPIRWVLVRDPNGKFAPQGFLCTNLAVTPEQIITWFRQRWQLEVTFEEVRAHLGVETQRQWSDKAIARTTPALFGLFSIVVLFAHQLLPQEQWHLRQSAGYIKARPTFVDALALLRSYLWAPRLLDRSGSEHDLIKAPSQVFSCWLEAFCYAA